MGHRGIQASLALSLLLGGTPAPTTAEDGAHINKPQILASLVTTSIVSPKLPAAARVAVPPTRAPYTALGHFDLEGHEAATLEFGPSSSQVAITSAHVLNSILYGPDSHASYSDDRGNTANIVAIYIPNDYDAQDPLTHGKYQDKAIVVFDRPIPGVTRFAFNPFDRAGASTCFVRDDGDTECHLRTPVPVDQAGYPFNRNSLTANIGGSISGYVVKKDRPDTFLLQHTMDIIPGDSGSAVWDDKGYMGIVQSTIYVTPITQKFIDCYNDVVRRVETSPPVPHNGITPIQVAKAEM